jgi:two-component system sensor kinase FixL
MDSPFDPAQHAGGVLASLLDASHDAIITTDLDGTIRSWNPAAATMFGRPPDRVIGHPITMLLPEASADVLTFSYARVCEGHRIELRETVRQGPNGHAVAVTVTLSPVGDDTGAIVGAVALVRDARDQNGSDAALHASEARWRAVVASAVDGMVMIDSRGLLEAFNPAAERLFGYRESEVLGQNVSVLMPSPHREAHDGYIARYLREGGARVIGIGREVTGRRKDGTLFPLQLSVGEVSVGGERKFTGILHDLTERVRLEAQLREQTAMARLGEMAAVIAHEVRNPLAGIRGAIQVIGGRLPAESAEAGVVLEIVNRIDALGELMKDLLLFARPPQPKVAQVDIQSLVMSTAELLRSDPAMSGVRVDVHGESPPVTADAGLLKIVFVNLLMNGAQAVHGHGTITVDVTSRDGTCSVVFHDSGPGIPLDLRQKVFTPFFTTKARGTGLGLPTAKQLVEAHRGRISIDCPAQGGTAVTVELPLHD